MISLHSCSFNDFDSIFYLSHQKDVSNIEYIEYEKTNQVRKTDDALDHRNVNTFYQLTSAESDFSIYFHLSFPLCLILQAL